MKKGRILHKDLNALIGSLAHGDAIVISDAGLAIPQHILRVELAIERDYPDLITILLLLKEELIVEKVQITEECKENNSPHFSDVCGVYKGEPVVIELIPHSRLLKDILPNVRAVVRTGAFCPYGNVVLYPGIDAPKWFERDGLKVPDFYKDRVPGKSK